MLKRINIHSVFCIGLFISATLFTTGIVPAPDTFIHVWTVELPTAVLFALCCLYFIFFPIKFPPVAKAEKFFVIVPIAFFILWSLLSAIWAESWKSALHHSLVWSMYLIFYLIARAVAETSRGRQALGLALLGPIVLFSIAAAAGYASFVIYGGINPLGRLAKVGEPALTILPLLLVFVVRSNGRSFKIGVAITSLISLLIFCSLGRINFFLFALISLLTAALLLTLRVDDPEVDEQGAESVALTRRLRFRRLMLVATACIAAPLVVQSFSIFSSTPDAAPVAVRRFGDTAAITSSNNFRLLVYAISKEMVVANPLLGIGADNFGAEANKYRRTYSAKYPDAVSLREADDNLPERAHNELLQISAELGLPGAVIAFWFAAGLLLLFFRGIKALHRGSIVGPAALIGLGAFLVSSMVSSYSFRFIQNGFVFFFVLAIACRELLHERGGGLLTDLKRPESKHEAVLLTTAKIRLVSAAGLTACLLLTAYWGFRVSSAVYVSKAKHTRDLNHAERLFRIAGQLDDENADARYFHGMRLFREKRFGEAAPLIRESIRLGRGRSVDYSHLASAWSLAGNDSAAERTMAEAVEMYPRSPFVLTRYSHVLSMNKKASEAERMLDIARQRHLGDANAWWILMTLGSDQASTAAVKYPDQYTSLMELRPLNALYAVRDERFARFPEERAKFELFGTNP